MSYTEDYSNECLRCKKSIAKFNGSFCDSCLKETNRAQRRQLEIKKRKWWK